MLGYWFLLQLLGGSLASGEGGVAFWAHVGGFVAGALLILVFKDTSWWRSTGAITIRCQGWGTGSD